MINKDNYLLGNGGNMRINVPKKKIDIAQETHHKNLLYITHINLIMNSSSKNVFIHSLQMKITLKTPKKY